MSEDDDSDEAVIDLVAWAKKRAPEDLDETLLADVDGHQRPCKHRSILLDPETRGSRCRDCDAVVDLFDWVSEVLIKEWRRNFWTVGHVRETVGRLRNEISDLKREKKNLDAQIRRRKKKLRDQ